MNINWPESGKYIIAVSGGVDSMCLLDLMANKHQYDLVVAHVDHGIREDSREDAQLVSALAKKFGFNIVITKLNFQKNTSENLLRQARYDFLFEEMKRQKAAAVITAHHADDLLETSIMNVRRGTDRYGAAGGMTREGIKRPLLKVYKKELLNYAKDHNLQWHEDSTNQDVKYTRNFVRHEVIPDINAAQYQKHLDELMKLNTKIDSELEGLVSLTDNTIVLKRATLNQLGLRELEVLIAYAIRQLDQTLELSQPQIARLAREVLLASHKNSFSYGGPAGIIVDIQ